MTTQSVGERADLARRFLKRYKPEAWKINTIFGILNARLTTKHRALFEPVFNLDGEPSFDLIDLIDFFISMEPWSTFVFKRGKKKGVTRYNKETSTRIGLEAVVLIKLLLGDELESSETQVLKSMNKRLSADVESFVVIASTINSRWAKEHEALLLEARRNGEPEKEVKKPIEPEKKEEPKKETEEPIRFTRRPVKEAFTFSRRPASSIFK